MIAIFVVALVLCALTADHVVGRYRLPASAAQAAPAVYVNQAHVWITPEPSGLAEVGLDEVATALLGRPQQIEWLREGQMTRGEPVAVVHGHGHRLVLRAPVDGVLIERKQSGAEGFADASSASLAGTWLARVRAAGLTEQLAGMHTGEKLREWMRQEMDRLRGLVVARLAAPTALGATALDGGTLGPAGAAELDDGPWNETARALLGEGFADANPTAETAGKGGKP